MSNCVFCQIVAGELPAARVWEDEHTLTLMDINPATPGHCLVVTRAHRPDLFGLGETEAAAVMATTRRVAAAVRRSLRPDGLNLLQSNGAVAFQTVFHFHLHVIPRYQDDPIKLPWIPRLGDLAAIADIGARIRTALAEDRGGPG